jgi:hypothetical protein
MKNERRERKNKQKKKTCKEETRKKTAKERMEVNQGMLQ